MGSKEVLKTGTYILAVVAVLLTVSMILKPEAAFEASVTGLKVWWDIVFPALLPFFIGSEILMGLGVVHCMGVLMEPLMRPAFNVPGAGSFVMAMGLASGYPIGAVLTAKLRRRSMCNKYEGERLMSFCNTADPLFMTGAVAVGMFKHGPVGSLIVVAHYLSAVFVGLCLRFYKKNAEITKTPGSKKGSVINRALRALVEARSEDGRPFGELLGDSIRQSVNSLLAIGGFIILFSVIIRMAHETGFLGSVQNLIGLALKAVGLDVGLNEAILSGFFEITMGAQIAGQSGAPLLDKVIIAGVIIAWSGLSVHAQVSAMIQDTDLDLVPYVFSRALHAIAAGAFTYVLWPFWGLGSIPAEAMKIPGAHAILGSGASLTWLNRVEISGATFIVSFMGLFVFASLVSLPSIIQEIRNWR